MRCWCWPGNTNDQAILPEVKDGLRGWRLGRVVTVVDRGFSSRDNLAYLQRAGGHYIAGERMRDGSPHAAEALSRQGRYQQVRDNLRVKEVKLDSTPGIRWIICHNPDEAERDAAARDAAISRIAGELDRITTARTRAREQARTRRAAKDMTQAGRRRAEQQAERDEAAHVKAECALREHPTLGRWLRQTPSGRLVLDRAKITAEARLDGKYLLSTSDPDLSAEDVALGYKNLLEAERGFRDLKSTIELRPVFHRIEPRIRAHVLLCWLALLLIRVAERRTGQTWRTINRELGRLARDHPRRAGRHDHPDHRTDHRPGRHSSGLRTDPAAPDHHPRPRLSSTNALTRPPAGRGHTPPSPTHTGSPRSTHRFGRHVCPPTAEPGADDRVVVTADTDFGTLLALSGASGPSVVLLCRSGRRVPERAQIVLTVLDLVADQLTTGAVVTVDNERVRIRPLPVDR
ncbi:MAG: IS1634 family transposase [Pseudonocardia sp.]